PPTGVGSVTPPPPARSDARRPAVATRRSLHRRPSTGAARNLASSRSQSRTEAEARRRRADPSLVENSGHRRRRGEHEPSAEAPTITSHGAVLSEYSAALVCREEPKGTVGSADDGRFVALAASARHPGWLGQSSPTTHDRLLDRGESRPSGAAEGTPCPLER